MTYEELVQNVKEAMKTARASKSVGHVAFQFNVTGEARGAFYLEISDGKIDVQPYEYYDRDLVIEASADVIMQMLKGELQPMVAYTNELLRMYGDVAQLRVLPFGCENKKSKM